MTAHPLYPAPRPAIKTLLLAKSSNRVWQPDSVADTPPITSDRRSFCSRLTGKLYPYCMILLLAWAVMREAVRPAGSTDRSANPHGCPFCV